MKRLYWRPRAISRRVVALVSVLAVLGLAAVEVYRSPVQQPYHAEKMHATELAERSMEILKAERLARGHAIEPGLDPLNSGMIGSMMTPTTTVAGSLPAKQTSINPNFAAIVVEMLKRAGVKAGDTIAIGCSGSFPAINTAVYAAAETLNLKPIIIASAGASQFGANFPDFLWIDMERVLHDEQLTSFRAIACSIGGYEDLGLGMTPEARQMVLDAIKRNGLELVEADNFDAAIRQRMRIYRQHAKGKPIKVYINVGGGTISVGRTIGKKMYDPGLNLRASYRALQIDSVMSRFMREGTPVIHLVEIPAIAERYGLPSPPEVKPDIGEGMVFVRPQYNRLLAGVVLATILISLRAFVLTDIGFRLFRSVRGSKTEGQPEPMV